MQHFLNNFTNFNNNYAMIKTEFNHQQHQQHCSTIQADKDSQQQEYINQQLIEASSSTSNDGNQHHHTSTCIAARTAAGVSGGNNLSSRQQGSKKRSLHQTAVSKNSSGSSGKRQKRKKSTDKERERNKEIKTRLRELTELMPFIGDADLPRIRILRLANQYILHLCRIVRGEYIFCEKIGQWRPLEKQDFAQVVNVEMQIKNAYSHRVQEEIAVAEITEQMSIEGNEEDKI